VNNHQINKTNQFFTDMRLSIGSAAELGLADIKQETAPTTCYIMLGDKCNNGCSFCSQCTAEEKLSRIDWLPAGDSVIDKINQSSFQRVCLQCTSATIEDVNNLSEKIRKPVSVSYNFNSISDIRKTKADKICIPLDAAKSVYALHKNGTFDEKLDLIIAAAKELPGRVSTHLIAGLGETEHEMLSLFEKLHKAGVTIGLFAFTPVKGTKLQDMPQPPISYYRRLQSALARITGQEEFRTSGCEGCNRPYYNERPGGTIYNYPRKLTMEEYKDAAAYARGK